MGGDRGSVAGAFAAPAGESGVLLDLVTELKRATAFSDALPEDPDYEAVLPGLLDQQLSLSKATCELLKVAVGTYPARTLAELRAKAEAAILGFPLNADGTCDSARDYYVAWSICRDLLALSGDPL